MKVFPKVLISFLAYTGILVSAYASVSDEVRDNKSISDRAPSIASGLDTLSGRTSSVGSTISSRGFTDDGRPQSSLSSHAFIEAKSRSKEELTYTSDEEWERVTATSYESDRYIALTDIKDLKWFFFKGYLEITPKNYAMLSQLSKKCTTSFQVYNLGVWVKGWQPSLGFDSLLDLLYGFRDIQFFKIDIAWDQETDVAKPLARALQFYRNLTTLKLKNCRLKDKGMNDILKCLAVSGARLQTLILKGNELSPAIEQIIRKRLPFLTNFQNADVPDAFTKPEVKLEDAAVRLETNELIVKPEPTAVKDAPIPAAVIKTEEQKTPSSTPLSPTTAPGSQAPVMNTAPLKTTDPNNNNTEDKPKALPLSQPSKKVTNEDIFDALNKVEEKSLSIEGLAALINSDPTFTSLELKGSLFGAKISPKDVKVLANALKGNTSLKVLDLKYNTICDEGVKSLAIALKGNTSLEILNLTNNKIGVEAGKALAIALKGNTSIKELHLANNKIGVEAGKALAIALKGNTSLKVLDLTNNKIGVEAGKALAIVLKGNTSIKELHLANNKIGDEAGKALAIALKGNTSLKVLDLKYNTICDEGVKSLAIAFQGNTSLTSLNLKDNQIRTEGSKALAEALKGNTSLEILNLYANFIGDEGGKALAIALKGNTSLKVLNLGHNYIDVEGSKALAITLQNNTSLTLLNFEFNNIGIEGVKALAIALKGNTSLEILDLYANFIGDAGVKALAIAFQSNISLQKLNLEHNKIGDEGGKALAIALKGNTSLKVLYLGSNKIGDEGIKALAEALKGNTSLKMLELWRNEIGEED